VTSSRGAPRGRLDGVPPVVRRLWSLLFRSVRRHAQGLERLARALNALGGDVNSLHAGLLQLEDDVRVLLLRADAHRAELDAVHRDLAALDDVTARVTRLEEDR
jgi:hypothetical protein